MEGVRTSQKMVAMLVSLMLALAAAFSFGVPEAAQAASAKGAAVKSVALKISGKSVKGKTYTLAQKKSAKLKVAVKPAKAKKKVAFKSSAPSIANVTAKGKITAKKAGIAKITVTVTGKNNKKKSAWVKVKVPKANASKPDTPSSPAASVTVVAAAGADAVAVGGNVTIVASTSDGSAVSWSSSDPNVASVAPMQGSPNRGIVTGNRPGTANITATTSTGNKAVCAIQVYSVPVQGVTLDQAAVTLSGIGTGSSLKETIEPANATNRNVTWTSSNPSVVTVDSNGVLAATGVGEASVTVTTVDGGYSATATVTVTSSTNNDVDGMQLSVGNPMDQDHPNVVLVGTSAQIRAKITSGGAPYKGDVTYRLEGVTGYTGLYEVQGFGYKSDENGIVSFYLGLKQDYASRKPILGDEESWEDNAAYATMKVTLTAGGANLSQEITVSFAQLLAATAYNDDAVVSVANGRDASIGELNPVTWRGNPLATSVTTEGYTQEYVVEQQVSDDAESNAVVLDAAPLLLLPASTDPAASGAYTADLSGAKNLDVSYYGTYAGVEDACVIEDVPGGLDAPVLTFSRLKLSDYTRLIVRAYVAGTDYPLTYVDSSGEVALVEKVIGPETRIDASSPSHVVQISDVFKRTSGYSAIDLKVFVESAGQVVDDREIGYTLTAVSGTWSTRAVRPYVYERLPKCVSWEVDTSEGYLAEDAMNAGDARTFLGANFNPNYAYRLSMPVWPSVGDAFIRGYSSGGELQEIYIYPTTSDKGSSSNKLEYIPGQHAVKVSVNQARSLAASGGSLSWSHRTDSYNRLVVDSRNSGYVQVTAHVNAYVKEAVYDAHSSVQFSNAGEQEVVDPRDYYALTGQTIELKAVVKSANGDFATGQTVTWANVAGATKAANTSFADDVESVQTKTDLKGETTLTLSSSQALDLGVVQAKCESYNVELYVAGAKVPTGAAALHWVLPGIYYKDDVEGTEYLTSGAGEVSAAEARYRTGDAWRIGTKVVGVGEGPLSAEKGQLTVEGIGNVRINLAKTDDSDGMSMSLTPISNGVGRVYSDVLGAAHLTASLGGLESAGSPCTITFSYTDTSIDGDVATHTFTAACVGQGDPKGTAGTLRLPIRWANSDIAAIDLDYSARFDVGNGISPMNVYARVTDAQGNGYPGVRVITSLADEGGQAVSGLNLTSTVTDANGYAVISFDTPSSAATYTLNASVEGGVSAAPATLYFTDNETSFTRSTVTPSDTLKSVTVKFSGDLSPSDIGKDWFKELFTLSDGGTKLDIAGVAAGKSADEVVITTVGSFTSTATVSVGIADRVTSDAGVTHYLLSDRGVLYSE